jgi:hypothetical protein
MMFYLCMQSVPATELHQEQGMKIVLGSGSKRQHWLLHIPLLVSRSQLVYVTCRPKDPDAVVEKIGKRVLPIFLLSKNPTRYSVQFQIQSNTGNH